MPYLIDGSNLVGFLPGFALGKGEDQDRLRRTLLRSPEVRKRGLMLVFDGSPSHGGDRQRIGPSIEVRYSGRRQDADTLIRHLLDKADPNHYILVTDDREIRDYARILRVKNIPCVEMARMLPRKGSTQEKGPESNPFDKDGSRPMSPDELTDWMEWFGE